MAGNGGMFSRIFKSSLTLIRPIAPLAIRFENYGITLSDKAREYQNKVLASPAVKLWLEQASQEDDIVAEDEVGQPV